MNKAREEQIVLGTIVKAKPRNDLQIYRSSSPDQQKSPKLTDECNTQGTVICIRQTQDDRFQYYIKFDAPELYNCCDWYYFHELQAKSGPHSLFKQPQIIEIRNIEYVTLGKMKFKTWFFSPYPRPFNQLKDLYVCNKCLKYINNQKYFEDHISKCKFQIPGIKIYEDQYVSVYEIDGRCEKLFCQLLCLFSKLFLDGKTLFYSTEMFIFYVMSINNDNRVDESIVGYFSKEKLSGNILSCIATFPQFMNQGFGTLLIQFAYILARFENRIAGPEEPLSYLGKLSFHSFWKKRVLEYLVTECCDSFGDIPKEQLELFYQQEQQLGNQEDYRSPLSASISRCNRDFEKYIADVSYELAMLEQHLRWTLDVLKVRVKNDSIIIKEKQYFQLCLQQYRMQKVAEKKGKYYAHSINEQYLTWEPYPAMFLGNDSVVPRYDDPHIRV